MQTNELMIIAWYRTLDRLQQQVLAAWLNTGDRRLALCLRLIRCNLHQIAQIAATEG